MQCGNGNQFFLFNGSLQPPQPEFTPETGIFIKQEMSQGKETQGNNPEQINDATNNPFTLLVIRSHSTDDEQT